MSLFTPWPCTELANYPLDTAWTDEMPSTHMTMLQYERHVGTLAALFHSPSLAQTYAQLKNYCFCQGALNNANEIDREFFDAILGNDLCFFKGHLGQEIQSAFPLERKNYPGIDVLRASHYDLFRVINSPILGFAKLQSLTSDRVVTAYTSLDMTPQRDEIVFGRLMPIGFLPRAISWRIVEPFDTVSKKHENAVLSDFQSQYDAFCNKFPGTTKAAFLKIAAYHIYESIQARELCDLLNATLVAFGERISARNFKMTFQNAQDVIDVKNIPNAKVITDQFVTVPLLDNKLVQDTLREAIVSVEDNVLEVTVFVKHAADKFMSEVIEPMIGERSVVRQTVELDENATYRSLRHIKV